MLLRFLQHKVYSNPLRTLLIVIGLAIPSGYMASKLKKNPSPDLLPSDHPSKIAFEGLKKDFTGTYPRIGILIESDTSVLLQNTIQRIAIISEKLEEISLYTPPNSKRLRSLIGTYKNEALDSAFVRFEKESTLAVLQGIRNVAYSSGITDSSLLNEINFIELLLHPVKKVTSLTTTDNILSSGDELNVGPIVLAESYRTEYADSIRRNVWGNEMFRNILLTQDSKKTGIYVETNLGQDHPNEMYDLYYCIKSIIEGTPGSERYYIAGYPVATAHISHVMHSDTLILFPIVIVIILTCLWLIFRALIGIVIPIFIVIFSILFTLAVQYIFGIPINIISDTIPVFLLSVGVADGLHIISDFQDNCQSGMNSKDALQKTMSDLLFPVILVFLTTALGFFTLAFTDIDQIRNFGIFVGLGSIFAMVLSIATIPVLLSLMTRNKNKKVVFLKDQSLKDNRTNRFIDVFLTKSTSFLLDNPLKIIIPSIAFITIASYFIYSGFYVDNNGVKYFSKKSELAISTNALNQDMAGSDVLNVVVSSADTNRSVITVAHLAMIDSLQRYITNQPIVGKTLSIVDLIKRMNYVMHNNDALFNRIPFEREFGVSGADSIPVNGNKLVSQYLLLYESNGGRELSDFVTFDYSKANIQIIVNSNSSRDVSALIDSITAYSNNFAGRGISFSVTGLAENNVAMNKEIVYGQLNGLLSSLVCVLLILFLIFRNVSKSVLGLLPILLTMIVNFGIMGMLKIPLDIGSAILTGIAFGIGIDYVIHYFSHLDKELSSGLSSRDAMINTVVHTGRPILYNAFVVGCGFLTLLFSGFVPLQTVGWMIFVTLCIACLTVLFLIPAMLQILKPKYLFNNKTQC